MAKRRGATTKQSLGIGLVGAGFMGRAHSIAWSNANKFFDPRLQAALQAVCARDQVEAHSFAQRWSWDHGAASIAELLEDPTIELVDVVTPNHLHAGHSIAALEAGKHVACEKPLAGTLKDARAMRDAARRGARRGQRTFVWFNYRRCPAVAFAHQLVRGGRLGRLMHVRACYLQDWGGANTPHSWRFQARLAGSGAHGDLNAHLIDMARFITGDEFVEVGGALEKTFITTRSTGRRGRRAGSTVDDCLLFLARFRSGAVASFEATRLATGNLNRNCIEINGERGSIKFDFERMNELLWWDHTLSPGLRGWSRILCTTAGAHPYADAYWPPGHGLGYEHGFVSMAADILRVIGGREPIVPLADFEDAYQTQRVLEGAKIAAKARRAVSMSEVR
jgi:predicted dehydrogenase